MSIKQSRTSAKPGTYAVVFAALGDKTRLAIVKKLAAGEPYSIAQLAQGSRVTRQAVRKHLRVLEKAGMVRGVKRGREHRFAFNSEPIREIKEYLDLVSAQWDEALGRLKQLVEK